MARYSKYKKDDTIRKKVLEDLGVNEDIIKQFANGGMIAQGALGGAATGASIGSVVPGWGTAIGGAIGGIAGGIGGYFKGEQADKLAAEQQRLQQNTLADSVTQQAALMNREPVILKDGGSIHIDPKNRGKFTETKKRTGKTTEELTHSKNPLTRKRAIFAQNAKKWKHEQGGELGDPSYITKLTPEEEQQFQQWYKKIADLKELTYNPDDENQKYDYRGYWKNENRDEMLQKPKDTHFIDKYKQPGHPTFSDESIYSNEQTQGGSWTQDQNGKWYFHSSPYTQKYAEKTAEYLNGSEDAMIIGNDTIRNLDDYSKYQQSKLKRENGGILTGDKFESSLGIINGKDLKNMYYNLTETETGKKINNMQLRKGGLVQVKENPEIKLQNRLQLEAAKELGLNRRQNSRALSKWQSNMVHSTHNKYEEGGMMTSYNGNTHAEGGQVIPNLPNGKIDPNKPINEVQKNEVGVNPKITGEDSSFVLSNDKFLTKKEAKEYNIPPKYIGKSLAEISKLVNKKIEFRKNDSINNDYMKDFLNKLVDINRKKLQEDQLKATYKEMQKNPELAQQMMNQMQQGQQQQNPNQQQEVPQEQMQDQGMVEGQQQDQMQDMGQQQMKNGGRIKYADGDLLKKYNVSNDYTTLNSNASIPPYQNRNYNTQNKSLEDMTGINNFRRIPYNVQQNTQIAYNPEMQDSTYDINENPEMQDSTTDTSIKLPQQGTRPSWLNKDRVTFGISQIGNAFRLGTGIKGLVDPDKVDYGRLTAQQIKSKEIDPKQQILNARTSYNNAAEDMRQSGANMSTYLANRMGLATQEAQQLAGIQGQADVQNIGIQNQDIATNAARRGETDIRNQAIKYAEDVDIAQNKGRNQSIIGDALSKSGSDYSQFARDTKADDMQQMLINNGWMNTSNFGMTILNPQTGKQENRIVFMKNGYKTSPDGNGKIIVEKDGKSSIMTIDELNKLG